MALVELHSQRKDTVSITIVVLGNVESEALYTSKYNQTAKDLSLSLKYLVPETISRQPHCIRINLNDFFIFFAYIRIVRKH